MRKIEKLVAVLVVLSGAMTWQGYDWQRHSEVKADKPKAVYIGDEIEIYDENDNQYKKVRVERVDDFGKDTEIKVYDRDRDEHYEFEMKNR